MESIYKTINDSIIASLKEVNPSLNVINNINNIVSFNSKSTSLDYLNLKEIINDYSQLRYDAEVMEPEDLLNIFKINEIIKENEFRRASGDNLKMNSIINVHEYHDLMMLTTPFSDKQTFQKNTFEKFMGELINYKNYLVQEGIYELGLYENYMSYLSVNGFYTKNEENALNTYYELQEKVKDIELKNAKAKALVLEYKHKQQVKQEKAGFASSLLIVEIVSMIGLALGALLVLLVY